MDSFINKRLAIFVCLLGGMVLFPLVQGAMAEDASDSTYEEETMLMFVGEDVQVLTIASRREESAIQAPAIAQVITREQIRERGFGLLGQILNASPGFYIAGKEWGSQPYLRGIPDSVLFLYDTVPIGSDTRKTFNPLGHELALTDVKRVEIIRGPGSVLWGPDAFAGIVNIVPLRGRDIDGMETGILYGYRENAAGFYVNMGFDNGLTDAIFSLSSRRERIDTDQGYLAKFWGDGDVAVPPDQRTEGAGIERSHFIETSARIAFGEALKVSARMTDNVHPYIMGHQEGESRWRESRSTPLRLVKIEAHHKMGLFSALRLTGTYTSLKQNYDIIDKRLSQGEETFYTECIYDRSFLTGTGLLTTGVSYREKHVRGAPIWDGYLPEYVTPDNLFLLPIITLEDYEADLWSVFGQYHQRFGALSAWIGARNDNHGSYRDHASWNTGAAWAPRDQWMIKILYGTAYRTPYARQLLGTDEPDLERIRSLNLQIGWRPSAAANITLSGFSSAIDNHLMEDPYAGLSQPNKQEIVGAEGELFLSLHKDLDINANITVLENSGADETYRYNYATFFWPDGAVERLYRDLSYPYDIGADAMANVAFAYRPFDGGSVYAGLRYFSKRKLVFPRGGEVRDCPEVWLADMAIELQDMPFRDAVFTVGVSNLFDKRYRTPGTYSFIRGDPLSLTFGWRWMW